MLRSKLVARKQGRRAEKASAGKEFAPEIPPCFRKVRRAYRAPGLRRAQPSRRAPLQQNDFVLGERKACPPGLRTEVRPWFLRAPPLLPVRATPEIRSILRLFRERWERASQRLRVSEWGLRVQAKGIGPNGGPEIDSTLNETAGQECRLPGASPGRGHLGSRPRR